MNSTGPILPCCNRAILIDANGDLMQGAKASWALPLHLIETIVRIKNGSVGGTNQLTLAGVIVNRDSCVRAGRLTGDKIAITKMDKQATLAIGGIVEVFRTICTLACITNDRTCVGRRRWSWGWRLRWLCSWRQLRGFCRRW